MKLPFEYKCLSCDKDLTDEEVEFFEDMCLSCLDDPNSESGDFINIDCDNDWSDEDHGDTD